MAPSAAYLVEMARLRGAHVIPKIEMVLDDITVDITAYYISGGEFDQEKERDVDEISSGDINFTFSNHNDYFSEYDASSLFYGKTYHNRKIKYSLGIRLPSGVIEYYSQFSATIQNIEIQQESNQVSIYCRDCIYKIVSERLNIYPTGLIPTAGGSNAGNGEVSSIACKPFSTVSETITITFSSASAFSVSGSVSGALGSGTVENLFTATGNKIRFLITAGTSAFVSGDTFTLTVTKLPEFTTTNVVKIIWALLTGYDYDTDTILAFSAACLGLDHTKSTANIDLNYTDFVTAIANSPDTILTGYVGYNSGAKETIQGLLALCLGAVFADGDGLIDINIYRPSLGATPREFSDALQITKFYYRRDIEKMINSCSGNYRKTNTFEWTDETVDLNGSYSTSDSTSITKYKTKKSFTLDTEWYSTTNPLIYIFGLILARESNAPLEIELGTGLDGLATKVGDVIVLTETKSCLSNKYVEVMQVKRSLGQDYKEINLRALDAPYNANWAFLGSSVDEGDGRGWEVVASQNYDTANTAQKQFAYLSTTGASSAPMYYIW